jgi:hypothetical protein
MKSIKGTKDDAQDLDLPLYDSPKDEATLRAAAAKQEKDRKETCEMLISVKRAVAWPLNKWPVDKMVAERRTKIHLPRTYLARQGTDMKAVREGADVNILVHQHYMEQLDLKTLDRGWVNFVEDEGVIVRW